MIPALISAMNLPRVPMKRIIPHWTAGGYVASSLDREHYHFLIEGPGNVITGHPSIANNVPPLVEGEYAAHTRGTNSHSIGVAVCAMAGAVESPPNAGKYPITKAQWDSLIKVLAQLCAFYSIPVTPKTVLTHAEVQKNLGIWQRGKWDIATLPFWPEVQGNAAVGDLMRGAVKKVMAC